MTFATLRCRCSYPTPLPQVPSCSATFVDMAHGYASMPALCRVNILGQCTKIDIDVD
jgi:hypothetical protein